MKASNVDPKVRKRPSVSSKDEEEKKDGNWIHTQKASYDPRGPTYSKKNTVMTNPEIWNTWTATLEDPEYMYALKPGGNRIKTTKPTEQTIQPSPEPEPKKKRFIRKKTVSPEPETKSNDKKIVEKTVEEPVMKIKDIDESTEETIVKKKKLIRKSHILPNKSEVIKGGNEKSSHNRKNSEYQEISRKWSSQKSTTTEKYLAEHPEEWIAYHDARDVSFEGYIQSELPRNRIIANLEKKSKHKLRILDLGCGRNYIAKHFTNHTKIKVIGYDHVIEDGSEARLGNIVNLQDKECDEGADICIYSQSLMGTDKLQYLNEGYRLLRYNGEMIISESVEMLDEIKSKIIEIGMKIEEIETSDSRWFLLCARKY
jgi:hypothetical protein